jgi:hypothetical protein
MAAICHACDATEALKRTEVIALANEEVTTTATSPASFEDGAITPSLSSAAGPISRRQMQLLLGSDVEAQLRGNVRKCAVNKAGSRLLVELLANPAHLGWIADELIGAGIAVAGQRFGCRVLVALVRLHFAQQELDVTASVLLEELLEEAGELAGCRHGSRVLCALLEHGDSQVRNVIARGLLPDLMDHCLDRYGSKAVACMLTVCARESRKAVVRELLDAHLAVLAEGPEGCRVLMALLSGLRCCSEAFEQLEEAEAALWATRHGRRLIKEFDIVEMYD